MGRIRPTANRWANPRALVAAMERQAALADPSDLTHGLTRDQVEALHERFDQSMPQLVGRHGQVQDLLSNVLPPGASWSRGSHAGLPTRKASPFGMDNTAFTGTSVVTPQRPYQPEFESPDRQHYPVHRVLANRYWRMFYKLDSVAGPVVDMISDLPFSDFQLTGEGIDGEIKDHCEEMCDETRLRARLPAMAREFYVVGEVGVHLYYDDNAGMWTYIAIHNPDQLEIIHSPILKMEPLVQFVPDDRLRQIVTSSHPILARIRQSMPPDLVARVQARENITLSPLNFTHIARKMHDYDVRGTSIFSRLWRIFMLEDAVFAAAIATARRNASPLKILKLGDPNTNWIPGPEQENKLLQLVAQSEADPGSWIAWNYALQTELVGVQERVLPITQFYPLIEQIKLSALGVSKSFISGEVSYSSAAAGLTVFLQRLKTFRDRFESEWLYPKFFRPIAEMNGWVKPTDAELSHRVRVKRSRRELREHNKYIVPTIKWEKSLDPTVDTERVNAMASLEGLGLKFSKRTKMAAVGIDYETELKQIVTEVEMEQDVVGNNTAAAVAAGLIASPGTEGAPGGGGLGGGGGPPPSMTLPGLPPTDEGGLPPEGGPPPEGGDAGGGESPPPSPAPEGAAAPTATPKKPEPKKAPLAAPPSTGGDESGVHWGAVQLSALADVFRFSGDGAAEPWDRALAEPTVRAAYEANDTGALWSALEEWLLAEGYPDGAILELLGYLEKNKVMASIDSALARAFGGAGLDGGGRLLFSGI